MRLFQRLISVILIFCLVENGWILDVYSGPVSVSDTFKPQSLIKPSLEQFAHVEQFNDSGKAQTPFFVHIRDLHCNYEAQLNIARTLEILYRESSEKPLLVLVEGAQGDVDVDFFGSFPDKKIQQEVSRSFLKEGKMTGPEYLGITKFGEIPLKITGIEEVKLYIDNLKSFRKVMGRQEINRKFIEQMHVVLESLKKKVFSEKLLELDVFAQELKLGHVGFEAYVQSVSNYVQAQPELLAHYLNIQIFLNVFHAQESLNMNQIESERNTLMERLSKVLEKEDLAGLVKKSLEYRLGKVSAAEYFEFLWNQAGRLDSLEDFPELVKYTDLIKEQAKLDETALFEELKGLIHDLIEQNIQGEEERLLMRLDHWAIIIEKMLMLEMSKEDLAFFLEHRSELALAAFQKEISEWSRNREVEIPGAMFSPENMNALEDLFQGASDFYNVALKRDEVLVQKAVEKAGESGAHLAVVITGGFHSEGVTDFLKKNQYGYVVLTPKVLSEPSMENYYAFMMDQRIDQQMLAAFSLYEDSADGIAAALHSPIQEEEQIRFLNHLLSMAKERKLKNETIEAWIDRFEQYETEKGRVLSPLMGKLMRAVRAFLGEEIAQLQQPILTKDEILTFVQIKDTALSSKEIESKLKQAEMIIEILERLNDPLAKFARQELEKTNSQWSGLITSSADIPIPQPKAPSDSVKTWGLGKTFASIARTVSMAVMDFVILIFRGQNFFGVPWLDYEDFLRGKTGWSPFSRYTLYRVYGLFSQRGYRITNEITFRDRGYGRRGAVRIYEALDAQNRKVVIKVGEDADEEVSHLFDRFGEPLLKPQEHLAVPLDRGRLSESMGYAVFEFAGGETLDQFLSKSVPSMADCLEILDQIVKGLEHVHASGIIHGDVHDQNIMIDTAGQVKLIDFEKGEPDNPLSRPILQEKDMLRDVYPLGKLALRILFPDLDLKRLEGLSINGDDQRFRRLFEEYPNRHLMTAVQFNEFDRIIRKLYQTGTEHIPKTEKTPDSYGGLKEFKDDLKVFSDMYLRGVDKTQAQKRVLRANMRKLRDGMPESVRGRKNRLLIKQLLENQDIKNTNVVLGYASYGSEAHTWAFLERMLKLGKRVLLPRRVGKDLEFYEVKNLSVSNGFESALDWISPGSPLAEPKTSNVKISIEDLADLKPVVLVPGLAFDADGNRLGQAQGYYDRFLRRLRKAVPAHVSIGVGYKDQIVRKVPVDAQDTPLDRVLTEEGILVPGRKTIDPAPRMHQGQRPELISVIAKEIFQHFKVYPSNLADQSSRIRELNKDPEVVAVLTFLKGGVFQIATAPRIARNIKGESVLAYHDDLLQNVKVKYQEEISGFGRVMLTLKDGLLPEMTILPGLTLEGRMADRRQMNFSSMADFARIQRDDVIRSARLFVKILQDPVFAFSRKEIEEASVTTEGSLFSPEEVGRLKTGSSDSFSLLRLSELSLSSETALQGAPAGIDTRPEGLDAETRDMFDQFFAKGYLLVQEIEKSDAEEKYAPIGERFFKAWDIAAKRDVFVKIRGNAARQIKVFMKDDKTPALEPHKNVARPLAYGVLGNNLTYSVSEFAQGKTLDQLYRERKTFSLRESISILSQIVEGVEHIRTLPTMADTLDLQSENIFVSNEGRVLLTDFEEQGRNYYAGNVIYEMGRIFLAMLAKQHRRVQANVIMEKIIKEIQENPLNVDVDKQVLNNLERMLEKMFNSGKVQEHESGERYTSMETLKADLDKILSLMGTLTSSQGTVTETSVRNKDGYIGQGEKSFSEFSAALAQGKFQDRLNDIERLFPDILKDYEVYGFSSIVRGRDDFVLGSRQGNKIYIAQDLVEDLKARDPTLQLLKEYLTHEILCNPEVADSHNAAIASQRNLFPQHYDSENYSNYPEDIIKDKGILRFVLRSFIDRQAFPALEGSVLEMMEKDDYIPLSQYGEIIQDEVLFDRIHELQQRLSHIYGVLPDYVRNGADLPEAQALIKKIYEGLAAGYMEDREYHEGWIQDEFTRLQELIKKNEWEKVERDIIEMEDEYGLREATELDPLLQFESFAGLGLNAVVKKVHVINGPDQGKVFALKVSSSGSIDNSDVNIKEEIQALTDLKDIPGVPRIYKQYGGRAVLMDYAGDRNLSQAGPQPKTFFEELAKIAWAIFKKGYTLHDLRDENIMVTEDGHPVIIDFGGRTKYESDRKESEKKYIVRMLADIKSEYLRGKTTTSDAEAIGKWKVKILKTPRLYKPGRVEYSLTPLYESQNLNQPPLQSVQVSAIKSASADEALSELRKRLSQAADLPDREKQNIEDIISHLALMMGEGRVYLAERNEANTYVKGFANTKIIVVNREIFERPGGWEALFHEAGESFFAKNPGRLPEGLNAHTYLRGLGEKAKSESSQRALTDIEKLLPVWKEKLSGLQDMLFEKDRRRLAGIFSAPLELDEKTAWFIRVLLWIGVLPRSDQLDIQAAATPDVPAEVEEVQVQAAPSASDVKVTQTVTEVVNPLSILTRELIIREILPNVSDDKWDYDGVIRAIQVWLKRKNGIQASKSQIKEYLAERNIRFSYKPRRSDAEKEILRPAQEGELAAILTKDFVENTIFPQVDSSKPRRGQKEAVGVIENWFKSERKIEAAAEEIETALAAAGINYVEWFEEQRRIRREELEGAKSKRYEAELNQWIKNFRAFIEKEYPHLKSWFFSQDESGGEVISWDHIEIIGRLADQWMATSRGEGNSNHHHDIHDFSQILKMAGAKNDSSKREAFREMQSMIIEDNNGSFRPTGLLKKLTSYFRRYPVPSAFEVLQISDESSDSGAIGQWTVTIVEGPTPAVSGHIQMRLSGIGKNSGQIRDGALDIAPADYLNVKLILDQIKNLQKNIRLKNPRERKNISNIISHLEKMAGEGRIYVSEKDEKNQDLRGFGTKDFIVLDRFLFESPMALIYLFHEAGESYFTLHPDALPQGVSAHKYLRGVGREARSGKEDIKTDEDKKLPQGKGLQDILFGSDLNDLASYFLARRNFDLRTPFRFFTQLYLALMKEEIPRSKIIGEMAKSIEAFVHYYSMSSAAVVNRPDAITKEHLERGTFSDHTPVKLKSRKDLERIRRVKAVFADHFRTEIFDDKSKEMNLANIAKDIFTDLRISYDVLFARFVSQEKSKTMDEIISQAMSEASKRLDVSSEINRFALIVWSIYQGNNFTVEKMKDGIGQEDTALLDERIRNLAQDHDLMEKFLEAYQKFPTDVIYILSTYLGVKPVSEIEMAGKEILSPLVEALSKKSKGDFIADFIKTDEDEWILANQKPLKVFDTRGRSYQDIPIASSRMPDIQGSKADEIFQSGKNWMDIYKEIQAFPYGPDRDFFRGLLFGYGSQAAEEFTRGFYDSDRFDEFFSRLAAGMGFDSALMLREGPGMIVSIRNILETQKAFQDLKDRGLSLESMIWDRYIPAILEQDMHKELMGTVFLYAMTRLSPELLQAILADKFYDSRFLSNFTDILIGLDFNHPLFTNFVMQFMSFLEMGFSEREIGFLAELPPRRGDLWIVAALDKFLKFLSQGRITAGAENQSLEAQGVFEAIAAFRNRLPLEYRNFLEKFERLSAFESEEALTQNLQRLSKAILDPASRAGALEELFTMSARYIPGSIFTVATVDQILNIENLAVQISSGQIIPLTSLTDKEGSLLVEGNHALLQSLIQAGVIDPEMAKVPGFVLSPMLDAAPRKKGSTVLHGRSIHAEQSSRDGLYSIWKGTGAANSDRFLPFNVNQGREGTGNYIHGGMSAAKVEKSADKAHMLQEALKQYADEGFFPDDLFYQAVASMKPAYLTISISERGFAKFAQGKYAQVRKNTYLIPVQDVIPLLEEWDGGLTVLDKQTWERALEEMRFYGYAAAAPWRTSELWQHQDVLMKLANVGDAVDLFQKMAERYAYMAALLHHRLDAVAGSPSFANEGDTSFSAKDMGYAMFDYETIRTKEEFLEQYRDANPGSSVQDAMMRLEAVRAAEIRVLRDTIDMLGMNILPKSLSGPEREEIILAALANFDAAYANLSNRVMEKAPGSPAFWMDSRVQKDEYKANLEKAGIADDARSRKKLQDAMEWLNGKIRAPAKEDIIDAGHVVIRTVPAFFDGQPILGMPRFSSAQSPIDLVYAEGRIIDGKLHVFVTEEFWRRVVEESSDSDFYLKVFSEFVDHEYEEVFTVFKQGHDRIYHHRIAAERARLFRIDRGLSPYHQMFLDQISTLDLESRLAWIKTIVSEPRDFTKNEEVLIYENDFLTEVIKRFLTEGVLNGNLEFKKEILNMLIKKIIMQKTVYSRFDPPNVEEIKALLMSLQLSFKENEVEELIEENIQNGIFCVVHGEGTANRFMMSEDSSPLWSQGVLNPGLFKTGEKQISRIEYVQTGYEKNYMDEIALYGLQEFMGPAWHDVLEDAYRIAFIYHGKGSAALTRAVRRAYRVGQMENLKEKPEMVLAAMLLEVPLQNRALKSAQGSLLTDEIIEKTNQIIENTEIILKRVPAKKGMDSNPYYVQDYKDMVISLVKSHEELEMIMAHQLAVIEDRKTQEKMSPSRKQETFEEMVYIWASLAGDLDMRLAQSGRDGKPREEKLEEVFKDLAFAEIQPKEKEDIIQKVENAFKIPYNEEVRKYAREGLPETVLARLKVELQEYGMDTGKLLKVVGSVKGPYAIARKAKYRYGVEKMNDIIRMRITVADEDMAYTVASLPFFKSRVDFEDYIHDIRTPLGYQSLHLVIPVNIPFSTDSHQAFQEIKVEVQIATPEMQENAEYGPPSHRIYELVTVGHLQDYENTVRSVKGHLETRLAGLKASVARKGRTYVMLTLPDGVETIVPLRNVEKEPNIFDLFSSPVVSNKFEDLKLNLKTYRVTRVTDERALGYGQTVENGQKLRLRKKGNVNLLIQSELLRLIGTYRGRLFWAKEIFPENVFQNNLEKGLEIFLKSDSGLLLDMKDKDNRRLVKRVIRALQLSTEDFMTELYLLLGFGFITPERLKELVSSLKPKDTASVSTRSMAQMSFTETSPYYAKDLTVGTRAVAQGDLETLTSALEQAAQTGSGSLDYSLNGKNMHYRILRDEKNLGKTAIVVEESFWNEYAQSGQISESAFLAELAKDMAKSGVIAEKLSDFIVLDFADQSPHLAENHEKDHFIWINKAVLNIADLETRRNVMRLAVQHELRHESLLAETEIFQIWRAAGKIPESMGIHSWFEKLDGQKKKDYMSDVEENQWLRDIRFAQDLKIPLAVLDQLGLSNGFQRRIWFLSAGVHELGNAIGELIYLSILEDSLNVDLPPLSQTAERFFKELAIFLAKAGQGNFENVRQEIEQKGLGSFFRGLYENMLRQSEQYRQVRDRVRSEENPTLADLGELENILRQMMAMMDQIQSAASAWERALDEDTRKHHEWNQYLTLELPRVIDQMRDILKEALTGTLSQEKTTFNAAQILKEVVNETADQSDVEGLKRPALKWLGFENEFPVNLNERHFRQIIKNLILNAIQAIPQDRQGELTAAVEMDERSRQLKIKIKDNGTGIAPENLNRIFEPYFTTKGSQGNGIGLAVAKEMAESENGSISVQSVSGEGTEFVLSYPLAGQASAVETPEEVPGETQTLAQNWTEEKIKAEISAGLDLIFASAVKNEKSWRQDFLTKTAGWLYGEFLPKLSPAYQNKAAGWAIETAVEKIKRIGAGGDSVFALDRQQMLALIDQDELTARAAVEFSRRFQEDVFEEALALYERKYVLSANETLIAEDDFSAIKAHFQKHGYRVAEFIKQREAVSVRLERISDGQSRFAKVVFSKGNSSTENFPEHLRSAFPDLKGVDDRIVLPGEFGNIVYETPYGDKHSLGFYVTEWVEGTTLAESITAMSSLDAGQIANWLRQIFEQLESLYEKGWIFWDINTGNMMLDTQGRVRIIDLDNIKPRGEVGFLRLKEFVRNLGLNSNVSADGRKLINKLLRKIDEEFDDLLYGPEPLNAFQMIYEVLNPYVFAESTDGGSIGKWSIARLTKSKSGSWKFDLKGIKENKRKELFKVELQVNSIEKKKAWEILLNLKALYKKAAGDEAVRELKPSFAQIDAILSHLEAMIQAGHVYVIENNPYFKGYGMKGSIFISRAVLESPDALVAFFHEAGESYFSLTNFKKSSPVSPHVLLRGPGKKAREGLRAFTVEERSLPFWKGQYVGLQDLLFQEANRLGASSLQTSRPIGTLNMKGLRDMELDMVQKNYPDEEILRLQDAYRKWERSLKQSGAEDKRKNFKILINTFNSPESLAGLLDSLFDELTAFEYGKGVEINIVEHSQKPEAREANEELVRQFNEKLRKAGRADWKFRYRSLDEQMSLVSKIEDTGGEKIARDMLYTQRAPKIGEDLAANGFAGSVNASYLLARSELNPVDDNTVVLMFDHDVRIQALLGDEKGNERTRKVANFFNNLSQAFENPNADIVACRLNGDPANSIYGFSTAIADFRKRLETAKTPQDFKELSDDFLALRKGKYSAFRIRQNSFFSGVSSELEDVGGDIVPFGTGFAMRSRDFDRVLMFNTDRGADVYQQHFLKFFGLKTFSMNTPVIHEKVVEGGRDVLVELPQALRLRLMSSLIRRWLNQRMSGGTDLDRLVKLTATALNDAQVEGSDIGEDMRYFMRNSVNVSGISTEASKILSLLSGPNSSRLADVSAIREFFQPLSNPNSFARFIITGSWEGDTPAHELEGEVPMDTIYDFAPMIQEWAKRIKRWSEIGSLLKSFRPSAQDAEESIAASVWQSMVDIEDISLPAKELLPVIIETLQRRYPELSSAEFQEKRDHVIALIVVKLAELKGKKPVADFIGRDFVDEAQNVLKTNGYSEAWQKAVAELLQDPEIAGAAWLDPGKLQVEGSRSLLKLLDFLKAMTVEQAPSGLQIQESLMHEYAHQLLLWVLTDETREKLKGEIQKRDFAFINAFAERYGVSDVDEIIAKFMSLTFAGDKKALQLYAQISDYLENLLRDLRLDEIDFPDQRSFQETLKETDSFYKKSIGKTFLEWFEGRFGNKDVKSIFLKYRELKMMKNQNRLTQAQAEDLAVFEKIQMEMDLGMVAQVSLWDLLQGKTRKQILANVIRQVPHRIHLDRGLEIDGRISKLGETLGSIGMQYLKRQVINKENAFSGKRTYVLDFELLAGKLEDGKRQVKAQGLNQALQALFAVQTNAQIILPSDVGEEKARELLRQAGIPDSMIGAGPGKIKIIGNVLSSNRLQDVYRDLGYQSEEEMKAAEQEVVILLDDETRSKIQDLDKFVHKMKIAVGRIGSGKGESLIPDVIALGSVLGRVDKAFENGKLNPELESALRSMMMEVLQEYRKGEQDEDFQKLIDQLIKEVNVNGFFNIPTPTDSLNRLMREFAVQRTYIDVAA